MFGVWFNLLKHIYSHRCSHWYFLELGHKSEKTCMGLKCREWTYVAHKQHNNDQQKVFWMWEGRWVGETLCIVLLLCWRFPGNIKSWGGWDCSWRRDNIWSWKWGKIFLFKEYITTNILFGKSKWKQVIYQFILFV